ncbi:MAG: 4-hydroxy-tetrahydrodipicolinate reductase [Treponema sp.]|jgi:4-hydroxy-tetrahydrodipicolinate reductase|nr:4-hydroxy-tetrahydrodipicolinate reductase [Treponema sp.]
MNFLIIGYGKMGKIIENMALEQGDRIAAAVDPLFKGTKTLSGAALYRSVTEMVLGCPAENAEGEDTAGTGAAAGAADTVGRMAALEFTSPATAPDNIKALAERGIPVVCGTTGWLDRLEETRAAVLAAGSSLLWASNFSLGINLFYRIAAFAAKLADPFPEYDVAGYEVHHNKKADSPSGTAKTLAELVLKNMGRKTTAVYETLNRPPKPEELHYASLRLGAVPGVHSLVFDSPADSIEITHSARNREALAGGALRAARWLLRCPGPGQAAGEPRRGIFTMDDALADILGT